MKVPSTRLVRAASAVEPSERTSSLATTSAWRTAASPSTLGSTRTPGLAIRRLFSASRWFHSTTATSIIVSIRISTSSEEAQLGHWRGHSSDGIAQLPGLPSAIP
jgi:hypothetical protein